MDYEILASGSTGNAVLIHNSILIDCGVPFTILKPHIKTLKIVLLTHQHGDHFKKSTVKKLAADRPTLRFGCCGWMVERLLDCGVKKKNIDVFSYDKSYDYGAFKVECFPLFHDVPNCGYKLNIDGWKCVYATDTSKILTEAKDFDLYLIEANYDEDTLEKRIEQKILAGVDYIYETRLAERHLSKQKADDFIYANIKNGEYVYIHMHDER